MAVSRNKTDMKAIESKKKRKNPEKTSTIHLSRNKFDLRKMCQLQEKNVAALIKRQYKTYLPVTKQKKINEQSPVEPQK